MTDDHRLRCIRPFYSLLGLCYHPSFLSFTVKEKAIFLTPFSIIEERPGGGGACSGICNHPHIPFPPPLSHMMMMALRGDPPIPQSFRSYWYQAGTLGQRHSLPILVSALS